MPRFTCAQPGVTTDELDKAAHDAIIDSGAYPSLLGFGGFPKSVSTSVNECICNGIPNSRPLQVWSPCQRIWVSSFMILLTFMCYILYTICRFSWYENQSDLCYLFHLPNSCVRKQVIHKYFRQHGIACTGVQIMWESRVVGFVIV